MTVIAIDAISMLHRIGAMTKTELISLVPGLDQKSFGKLMLDRLIEVSKGFDDKYVPTPAGLKLAGLAKSQSSSRRKKGDASTNEYSGVELLPFTGRAGAMTAFSLPSRIGNQLVYRNGHTAETDHAT